MTNADRLQRWNLWYEQTPEKWRFQFVLWILLIVGAVNMLLTVAVGFPFALLVGIAIAIMAAIRVPYALGWLRTESTAAAAGADARMEIEAPSWVIRLNRWYDSLDDMQRALVLLAALAIPGMLNMLLTFAGGFPFGLLFLLALLAVLAIRAPYTAGWLKEAPDTAAPTLAAAPETPRLGDESAAADPLAAEPRQADGASLAPEAKRSRSRPSPAAAGTPPESPPG